MHTLKTRVGAVAAVNMVLLVFGSLPASGRSHDVQRSVFADEESIIVVDAELSPSMVSGPLTRCICFELYEDCLGAPIDLCEKVAFTDGMAVGLQLSVPEGLYQVMTARDPLHTLQSASEMMFDGILQWASFAGDPLEGGHWLRGGNLDAWSPEGHADVIDILDYGMYVATYGTSYGTGDTTCDTEGPHGDLNGDGLVDSLELSFIVDNFLGQSEEACPPEPSAPASAPVLDIPVAALESCGLEELSVADLNSDGRVNLDDLSISLQGDAPGAP